MTSWRAVQGELKTAPYKRELRVANAELAYPVKGVGRPQGVRDLPATVGIHFQATASHNRHIAVVAMNKACPLPHFKMAPPSVPPANRPSY